MPELFTEIEAGKYLGGTNAPIGVRTMQYWRATGTGPIFRKIGRHIRYAREDLDAFLNASRRGDDPQRAA